MENLRLEPSIAWPVAGIAVSLIIVILMIPNIRKILSALKVRADSKLAKATITDSYFERAFRGIGGNVFRVNYTFIANGKNFQGSDSIRRSQYSQGKTIPVKYSVTNPSYSQAIGTHYTLFVLLLDILILITIVGSIFAMLMYLVYENEEYILKFVQAYILLAVCWILDGILRFK